MHLSVQKRRFIHRLSGYASNPIANKWRTIRGREQVYDVDGISIVLPPDHNLPFYQRRDPTYDHYAIGILRKISSGHGPMTVIDVGANVGDTAAAVLTSDPTTSVVSVEGDHDFVGYLRRNLEQHHDRAVIVDGFVGPVGSPVTYSRHGTTGGFNASGDRGAQEVSTWIAPQDLLSIPASDQLVVWKSDIDGFDIHVLVRHWDVIIDRCEVLWFEFDPFSTLGDRADIEKLIDLLSDSGRVCIVFDNLGRQMLDLEPGPAQGVALSALTRWLIEQREGHMTVPYLDIWLLSPRIATSIYAN